MGGIPSSPRRRGNVETQAYERRVHTCVVSRAARRSVQRRQSESSGPVYRARVDGIRNKRGETEGMRDRETEEESRRDSSSRGGGIRLR